MSEQSAVLNTRLLKEVLDNLDKIFVKLDELDRQIQQFNQNSDIRITLHQDTLRSARALDEISRAFKKFSDSSDTDIQSAVEGIIGFMERMNRAINNFDGKQIDKATDFFAALSRGLNNLSNIFEKSKRDTGFIEQIERIFTALKNIDLPESSVSEKNFTSFIRTINGFLNEFEKLESRFSKFGSLRGSSQLFLRIVSSLAEAFQELAKLGSSSEARNIGALVNSFSTIIKTFADLSTEFEKFRSLRRSSGLFLRIIDVLGKAFRKLKGAFRSLKGVNLTGVAALIGGIVSAVRQLVQLDESFRKLTSFIRNASLFRRAVGVLIEAVERVVRGIRGVNPESITAISEIINNLTQIGSGGDLRVDENTLRSFVDFVKDLGDALRRFRINRNTVDSLDRLFRTVRELKGADSGAVQDLFGIDISSFENTIRRGARTAIVEVLRVQTAIGLIKLALSGVASAFRRSFNVGLGFFSNSIDEAIEKSRELTDIYGELGENLRDAGEQLIDTFGIQNILGSDAFQGAVDFDRIGTQLQIFGGLTDETRVKAEAFANEIGRQYPLSANDALAATLDLVKAGQDLESIEFILPAAADLASLSDSGDLNRATETLIASVAGFSEFSEGVVGTFENISVAADLLAGGADVGTASVESLSAGLANVGPSANAFGLSLEETIAILSIFDENAISGAEGGTALRAVLDSLGRPQTQNALSALESRLGLVSGELSLFREDGTRRDINSFMNSLNSALSGLNEQERSAALNQLADTFGRQGLNILLNQGEDGILNVVEAIGEVDPASERAAASLDNFAGDVTQLQGSFETLLTRALLPTLERFFRPFVKIARFVVDALLSLDDAALAFLSSAAVIASLLTTVVGGFLLFAGAVLQVGAVIIPTVLILANLQVLIFGILTGLTVFAAGLITIAAAAAVFLPVIIGITTIFESLFKIFKDDIGSARTAFVGFLRNTQPFLEEFGNTLQAIGVFLNRIFGIADAGSATLEGVGLLIRDFFFSLSLGLRGDAGERLLEFLTDLQTSLSLAGRILEFRFGDSFNLSKPIEDFFESIREGESVEESFEQLRSSMLQQIRFLAAALEEGFRTAFGDRVVDDFLEDALGAASERGTQTLIQIIRQRIIDAALANRETIRDTIVSIFRFLFTPFAVAQLVANVFGIQALSTFIANVENFFAGALSQLIDLVFNLLDGQNLSEAIIAAFGEDIEPVVRFAQVLGKTVGLITDIIGDLLNLVFGQEIELDIGETVFGFLEQLGAVIERLNDEVLAPLAEGDFVTAFANLAAIILEALNNLFSSLINIDEDESLGSALLDLGVRVVKAVIEAIKQAFISLSELTGINFESVTTSLLTKFGEFVDQFATPEGRSEFVEKAGEIVNAIIEAIQSAFTAVTTALDIDFNAIGTAIKNGLDDVVELFTTAEGRETIIRRAGEILDAIIEAIQNAFNNFESESGINISDTIVGLFNSGLSDLKTASQNFQLPDLDGVANTIIGLFDSGLATSVKSTGGNSFTFLVNTLLGVLGQAIVTGLRAVSALTGVDLDGIATAIASTINTVIAANIKSSNPFSIAANLVVGSLALAINLAFGGLADLLNLDATGTIEDISNSFSGLFDALDRLTGTIGQTIKDLAIGVTTLFSSLSSGEGGEAQGGIDILQLLFDLLGNIVAFSIDTLTGIVNGVSALIDVLSDPTKLKGLFIFSGIIAVIFGALNTTALVGVIISIAAAVTGLSASFAAAAASASAFAVAAAPVIVTILAITSAILLIRSIVNEFDELADVFERLGSGDILGAVQEFFDFVVAVVADLGGTIAGLFGFDSEEIEARIQNFFRNIGNAIARSAGAAADNAIIASAQIEAGIGAIGKNAGAEAFLNVKESFDEVYGGLADELDIASVFSANRGGLVRQGQLDSFARLTADVFVSSFADQLAQQAGDVGVVEAFAGPQGEAFRNALRTALSSGLGPEFFAEIFATGDSDLLGELIFQSIEISPDSAGFLLAEIRNAFNTGIINEEEFALQLSNLAVATDDVAVQDAANEIIADISNGLNDAPNVEADVNVDVDATTESNVDPAQVEEDINAAVQEGVGDAGYEVDVPVSARTQTETVDLGLGGVDSENAAVFAQDVQRLRTNLALLEIDINEIGPVISDVVTQFEDFDGTLQETDERILVVAESFRGLWISANLGLVTFGVTVITVLIPIIIPALIRLGEVAIQVRNNFVGAFAAANVALLAFGSTAINIFSSIQSGAAGAINSVNSLASSINDANQTAAALAGNTSGGGSQGAGNRAIGGTVDENDIVQITEGGSEVYEENGKSYLLARTGGRVLRLDQALPELDLSSARQSAAAANRPARGVGDVINNNTNMQLVLEGDTVSVKVDASKGGDAASIAREVAPRIEKMLQDKRRKVGELLRTKAR